MGLSTTYTKTETDFLIQQRITTAYLGIATTTTTPPATGAYWYRVDAPGTYMGVSVTAADFKDAEGNLFDVTLEVKDGAVKKSVRETPKQLVVNDIYLPKLYENMINVNSLIDKSYINQVNGQIIGNVDGFKATPFIKVIPNKRYTIPGLYKQFAFYDVNYNFINDNQSSSGASIYGLFYNIKTPANAYYIRLSLAESDGVNKYYLKLNEDIFPPLSNSNVITVKKQGGNFNLIRDAIDFANSTGKRCTILIDEGEWLEELRLITGNQHILKGMGKESTIITNHISNLFEPMKVMGGWHFEDLQIRNVGRGYAVHADYPGEGVIEFNRCKIVTYEHAALGCGSHQNQTIRLRDCEVMNKGAYIGAGTLYWHSNVNSGVTGQRLEVINTTISSNSEMALRLEDANYLTGDKLGGEATVMFINSFLYSKGWKKNLQFSPSPEQVFPIGSIKLDERSFGNNIPVLNF